MSMHTRIARFLVEHFTIMVVGAWAVIGSVGLVVHRPWIWVTAAYITAAAVGVAVAQAVRRHRSQHRLFLQFARAAWVGAVLRAETGDDQDQRPLLVCLPPPPLHLLSQFGGSGFGPCSVCLHRAVWIPPQTVSLVAQQEAAPACPGCVIQAAHKRVGWRFAIHSSLTSTLIDQGKLGEADQWVTWMNRALVSNRPVPTGPRPARMMPAGPFKVMLGLFMLAAAIAMVHFVLSTR